MATVTAQPGERLRDLGDGLIMRRGRPEDATKLVPFETAIFSPRAADLVAHFLRGAYPTCGPADFTVVEDEATGDIVSSLCLIQQRWSYDGIPFGVGQPEFVLTDPARRSRGLIRAQMEQVHAWSAARGDLVQGITGIPYYYRQFGYEMTIGLGGARIASVSLIPRLPADQAEPVTFRAATGDDIAWIADLWAGNYRRRSLLVNERSAAEWRAILEGWRADEPFRETLTVIQDAESGERVGFLLRHGWLRGMRQLAVGAYEVVPGRSWQAVTPAVLRHLGGVGAALAAANRAALASDEVPDTKERDIWSCEFINFWFGPEHPVFHLYPDLLARTYRTYAWYIRVPDLPAFITRIAPALERRLAASPLAGHTGEVWLSFYRSGLSLSLVAGRVTATGLWNPLNNPEKRRATAAFPDLTFLHLLFGSRSLAELRAQFADCYTENDDDAALLDALFPKRTSSLQSWGSDG